MVTLDLSQQTRLRTERLVDGKRKVLSDLSRDPCSSSFDCSGPPSSEACIRAETGREFRVRM